jgi:kelch-like protein 20
MSTARKHLGCAVYNDYIYAVGGRDDCTELNSVERYCDKDDRWTPVVAMQMKRSGVGLAVVGGQLLGIYTVSIQYNMILLDMTQNMLNLD